MIMQAVGVAEDNIFKKRKEDEVRLTHKHLDVEGLEQCLLFRMLLFAVGWF